MPRILLVDDDIAEISAVKRVLARAGHQPTLATNASDAQVAVDHERPDLLLVSSTCEGGDALGLARRLSEDPATAGIPLIVLGEAASLPESARRLARPVDPEQLTAEVTTALGGTGTAAVEAPAPGARATALGRIKPGKAPPPPPPGQRPAQGGLPDAAAARRAAAEALRARAEELRRSPPRARASAAAAAPAAPPPAPPPARRSISAPILLPPLPEKALAPRPRAAAPAPAAAPPPPAPELDLDDGELEAALRRASAAAGDASDGAVAAGVLDVAADEDARHQATDEALRALEAEAQARPDRQAEERALQQAIETARREAFETARRELEGRARHEAAEAARRLESEARARREEVEELSRREAEETRRRGEAEAQAQAEAEARRHAEKELAALRAQREAERQEAEQQVAVVKERAAAEGQATEELRRLAKELAALRAQREAERQEAEQQVAAVKERAAAEGQAAEELRRLAEEEVRRRDQAAEERGAEEERLRAAIASARAELDELRERNAEEVRRRAEAEEALGKLADAARREAERRETEEREAAERQAEAAATPPASQEGTAYTPPPFFGPFEDAQAHAGEREAAEGAARRRVAALRSAPAEPPTPPDGAASPRRAPAPLEFPEDGADPMAGLAPLEALEEPARLMVQPPAQLRGGNLAELPAPRLLAQAARVKASGRFDFEGEVARSIWLEDGQVVGASSADPAERLEEVALRLGLVTRDQHRQIAQSAAALPARRAALLLLERGFLKPTELTGLVRRRTEEVVFGVFADPEASFRWVATEVPPEERIALSRGALALAVEGVRRRWLAPRVDALLGGPGTLLVPVAGGPTPAELGLSPEERRAVALADGLRTLDEISGASPLDPLSTRQALAALVLCGALNVRLLQAGRPAGQAAAAIDLARVKDKLDQVRRADYFTVLGVSRLCTPHEVREAADRLRAEFEPRRFAGTTDDGLPARLAEILQVVEDARAVLADDRLRDEYLRGLG